MTRCYTCPVCYKFYYGFGHMWNSKRHCDTCIGKVQFKKYFDYIRSSPRILTPKQYLEMKDLKQALNEVKKN